jgi:hypothetical protein
MVKAFSLLSLAVAIVVASGCATNAKSVQRDHDLVAAVSAMLTSLQRDGKPVKLVRGSNVSDAKWAVLWKTPLIAVTPDPNNDNSLAEGSFRLDEIDIRTDSAYISGVLGPIPKPKPGIMLACGTEYKTWLKRDGSGWRVLGSSITVC